MVRGQVNGIGFESLQLLLGANPLEKRIHVVVL